MGPPARVKKFTPAEYLELERKAEYRSDYFNGEIFPMAGGTPRHSLLQTNLTVELRQPLKNKPCTVYNNAPRILIDQTGLYAYPDASIVCGELEFAKGHNALIVNPTVLLEVLSDSREAYDRGAKFAHYRKLKSLLEYVLISREDVLVERFQRNADNTWTLTESRGLEATLTVASVNVTVPLSEIYDKADFTQPGVAGS